MPGSFVRGMRDRLITLSRLLAKARIFWLFARLPVQGCTAKCAIPRPSR
jgi:hypothetical protein